MSRYDGPEHAVTSWRCLRCGASGRGEAPKICPGCGTGKEASIVQERGGSRPPLDTTAMSGAILPKDDPRRAAHILLKLVEKGRWRAPGR
jgi:hypothetical protein